MIQWLSELLGISYTTVVVALGSSVLGIAAGALGVFAVLRQRSLMGDALAHAALPGVALAFMITGTKDPMVLLIGAAAVGILGALMMVGLERTPRITSDVSIGVVLSTFFSLGIVLLTYIAKTAGANQAGLEKYLFGQAAGIVARDVALMSVISLVAIIAVVIAFRPLKTTLFDVRFAGAIGLRVRMIEVIMTVLLVVAIIVGLRTVGAILMVAMLIIPTATARQFTPRLAILIPVACLTGAFVGVTGSLVSTSAALPTGPVIALVGLAVVMLALVFAPGRGIAWRTAAVTRRRRRRADEATLLTLGRHEGGVDAATLESRSLRRLRRRNLADLDHGTASITPAGRQTHDELVRERHLWSLWLVHGWRVPLPDAREPTPATLHEVIGRSGIATLTALEQEGAA